VQLKQASKVCDFYSFKLFEACVFLEEVIESPLYSRFSGIVTLSRFTAFFVTLDSEGAMRGIDDFSRELTEATFSGAARDALNQRKDEGVI
jgi:hypothetical protein